MTASSSKPKMLCKEFATRSTDMLQTGQILDCTFLVGPESDQELISANKVILALTSEYFHAMFYRNIAEKNDPISIPDVYPAHFKKLLNYIYTSEVQISSLDEANGLYYCAKQFLLPHLQQLCSEYLMLKLDASNVCHIHECAELYDDDKLREKVTEIMTDATKLILHDPTFEEVKLSTLLHIFSLGKLCIDSEIDLLEAAVRYNEAQGNESLKQIDDKTKLPIQRAIEKIRFLTLSPKEFAESRARTRFLSESEALAILLNISSNNTDVPYPNRLCNISESRIQAERSKTFSLTIQTLTNLDGKFLSARNYVCNFPWRIIASIYSDEQMEKYLSVYLVCAPKSSGWKCLAECELRVCSQISDIVGRKQIKQFSDENKSYYYGLSKFVLWRDVLDPSKGYIKDGAVTLQASLTVREYSYN